MAALCHSTIDKEVTFKLGEETCTFTGKGIDQMMKTSGGDTMVQFQNDRGLEDLKLEFPGEDITVHTNAEYRFGDGRFWVNHVEVSDETDTTDDFNSLSAFMITWETGG